MKIRKATKDDALAIATVHVNSWKTTYQLLIPEDYLNSLDIEIRKARWKKLIADGSPIFVAVDQDEIIGFANGGQNRSESYQYDGELYAIYLLKEAQRKGAGKMLLCSVAKELKKESYRSMLVWVLNGNPASQFYQSFHPLEIAQKEIEIAGKKLLETAFGWPDLDDLIATCS
ncbi:GNAT family N-acetyltransferase [Pseudalkalibacillus hwajinpoensis]|uniref:GNAT family N-acetyltransferase n=1 Tax=Guptibacillus hwajinpoensis TaxID=208199 RepID=UPI001CFCE2DC|nr:GNAT family N-acetyltransferase [Pseudalkalibacillus hwajinpoensis]